MFDISKHLTIVFSGLIILTCFNFFSVGSVSGTTIAEGTGLVVEYHIIRIDQDPSSPNVFMITETITFNNTKDQVYDGPVYFWLMEPIQIRVIINDVVYKPVKIGESLYSLDLSGIAQLEPNGFMELTLIYAVEFQERTNRFEYVKEFQYTTDAIMVAVFSVSGYEVESKEIELTRMESAYVIPHQTGDVRLPSASAGETIEIIISKESHEGTEETGFFSNMSGGELFILVLFIMIMIGLIIHVSRRREKEEGLNKQRASKDTGRDKGFHTAITRKSSIESKSDSAHKEVVEVTSSEDLEKERKDLISEKKKVLLSKKRLKKDFKAELLTSDMFNDMNDKYQMKLKDINKKILKMDRRIEDERVKPKAGSTGEKLHNAKYGKNKLAVRKRTLLSVLKYLDQNYENGNIPIDIYEELKAEYKKETVEVLKAIDQINRI